MNTTANTTAPSTPTTSTTRTYLWLIKRELWEHRAIFIAPLIVAAIVLLGTLIAASYIPRSVDLSNGVEDLQFDKVRVLAYVVMAMIFNLVMTVVIGYYVLDALYADRRDRSVLFWKSLPISDIESVVSKLFVAVVVAPLVGLAFAIVTQLLVAAIFTVALLITGHNFVLELWSFTSITEIIVLLIYAVVVQTLWYLPVWAWCLLASAWARRSPFLVAIIPPLALALLEAIVFRTSYVNTLIAERLNGVIPLRFSMNGLNLKSGESFELPAHLTDLINPTAFLATPQLWIGLIAAGALIAATVWMRRYRELN